ncbi:MULTISPECIES: hypothetical protein [unclassified Agromyces]|uniref:hypothetical protein n=1 Tax=unclassified Agromyces TaxID=2639701 RepID=UPI003014FBC8
MVAVSALLVALTGCAADRGGAAPAGGHDPALPTTLPVMVTEVHAVGTVLQLDEDAPQLCLGAIAESYPPQCGGPEIAGWDWDGVEGEESASGVTWGAYAVWGDWDGETVTVTREPILAALYDPMVEPNAPDPWDPALPEGPLREDEASALQSRLEGVVPGLLSSAPVNGRLVVEVRFDDGTLQRAFDERYGEDAVVVIAQLRPAD